MAYLHEKPDGRVTRAERLRRERRDNVLACARRVFSRKGYHAASIADIIDEAQIARGTFYLYFVSKRAIFDELLDTFFALLTREVKVVDVGPHARPPMVQMRENVRHVLATLVQNRDLTQILLREAVGLDKDFDHKLDDFYGRILVLIRNALETGKDLGIVRECDSIVTSFCILGAVKELVGHLIHESDPGESAGVDLDQAADEVLAFNLSGVFRTREKPGT